MASRIPIIDQTTSAGGTGPSYLRGGQQTDAIGPALQNLGRGAQSVADGMQQQQIADLHVAKKQEQQDAVVWSGKTLSDAQLQWQDELERQKESAPAGAAGFTPKLIDQFDKWSANALEKAPNDTSRRYLQQHLNTLRTGLASSAINFEAQARVDDRVTKVKQSIDATSQAVMGAPNEANFKTLYAQRKAEIDALEVPPKMRQDLLDNLHQSVTAGYWLGRIRQDPEAARTELEKGIGPSASEAAKSGGTPGTAASGDLWSALIAQESGGRQSAVSPKGAIGAAQIMPGTAPEAAKLAGLPYDAERLKTDQAYNEALGKAYLNKQLETFGGDTKKALAAYNMGPGNAQKGTGVAGLVAKWGDDWLSHAPKETQNYVAAITAKTGGGARPVLLADASNGLPPGSIQPSGSSVTDSTPLAMRLQMIQQANSEINRVQSVYRAQITTTENDHVSAYMNGASVAKPLTEQDYTRAYGPIDGQQRFANYQAIATLGGDIKAMQVAKPDQIAATLERYKPDSTKPGYDLATKRYEIVAKAANQINQQRQADPVQYAITTGIGGAKPLQFNDPQQFAAGLGARAGLASTMQQTYGTPFQVLSKAEAQTLATGFTTMTTQQKLGYLETMRKAMPDGQSYRTVMQQIAPDSPVTAMAGAILSKQSPVVVGHMFGSDQTFRQQDVAGVMLEGEALLNPNKAAKGQDGKGSGYPMPKEQDLRSQFNSVVGKAFAGDAPGADFAFQAVKAYYAGKGARDGEVSGELDAGRLKDAITAVIGGVSDVNGKGEVVRPWGMSEARFSNTAKSAYDTAMAAAGLKGSAVDNWGAYGLQSAGDSKYVLRSGTGYLTDRAGNPIVLDLTEKPSAAALIPTAGNGQPVANGRGWTGQVVQPKAPDMNTSHPRTK